MRRAPLAIAIAITLPLERLPFVELSTWAFGYCLSRFNEAARFGWPL